MAKLVVRCKGCGKTPSQLREYVGMAAAEGYGNPDDFVKECEGTFNQKTGLFWCTDCYIKAGQPLGVA